MKMATKLTQLKEAHSKIVANLSKQKRSDARDVADEYTEKIKKERLAKTNSNAQ